MSSTAIAICAALAPFAASAQTALWTGDGPDQNYTTPGNWSGGVVPPNTGTYTVDLSNMAPNQTINVNTAANVAGIVLLGETGPVYTVNGTGSLTVGSGGIAPQSSPNSILYLNIPVTLSSDETWNGSSNAFLFAGDAVGQSGGSRALTIDGRVYLVGDNTFTGGLTVLSSGTVFAGSNQAAGTGTLTLDDSATFQTWSGGYNIPNAVSLGNNVNLGTDDTQDVLTFSGPVTAVNAATNINISSSSTVYLTGTLGGPASTMLTITGVSAALPEDGGSQLVFQGALSQVSSLTVSGAQVILAPTGNTGPSFASLSSTGVQVLNEGYLGLDGRFDVPGSVANFIYTYGPGVSGLGANISGTLGFDTIASPNSPQIFSDPINLTNFTSSGFLGLGSATSAILSGIITPTSNDTLPFGGGGGTLTVTSDLNDGSGPTSLVMSAAPSPLTLILQGANNYTGGVQSMGGVLIFDSAVLPSGINLNGGYVGDTEVAGLSSAAFISLFETDGPDQGVIGFDQHTPDPSNPRQISDTIDLSAFNGDSNIFIGTATAAELTSDAAIIPANNAYQFTGVKGGILTVDTQLTDNDGTPRSLTLGLPNPIESNGSISTVNLTATNTYTGGTTINSGSVFVSSSGALGASTGTVSIPDGVPSVPPPSLASYGGSPVTLMNPIAVGSYYDGSTQGVTLGNPSPSGNDMLVLCGVISDYNYPSEPGLVAISGPVTLGAANTYTGGTIITGTGSAVVLVTNPMSFGSPSSLISVQDDGVIAPFGGNVTLSNPIGLNYSPLTLGQDSNPYLLTLNGIISGNGNLTIDSSVALNAANTYNGPTILNEANVIIGASGSFGNGSLTLNESTVSYGFSNPMILDLTGYDANSAVSLTTGQTLTLETDSNGGSFAGAITGDSSDQVVVSGTGIQQLTGNSTYGGGTTVSSGTLIAGSSTALGTGPVTVASGAQLGVAYTTLTLPITLSGNSTLSGSGTFSPTAPITFSSGNTVMPGFAINGQYISTLSFGNNVVFGTNGIYQFNLANASGTAGSGYSTISIGGTLTVASTLSMPFLVSMNSITTDGTPGMAAFSSTVPYSWTILSANGGITGFNPTLFSVSTAGFQNSLGGGYLTLAQSGDNLTLNFTPVPEPSTWALMLGGVAAIGFGLQRRRRPMNAGAGCR